jgi:hypothetical protein
VTASAPGGRTTLPSARRKERTSRIGEELARRVATALLEAGPGDRLPTVRSLAAACGASVGAVQAVITGLEADGIIEVNRKGHLGTFLARRSVGGLWAVGDGGPLVLALPLPTTPHVHGLATALKTRLTDAGVESFTAFIRGSRQRLEALREGRCHIAVMSALAAGERGAGETIVLELPPGSYVAEHRVYYTRGVGSEEAPLRVVIDRDSADFQRLTELEFGDRPCVRFVPATYMQATRLLSDGSADAVVWDAEEGAGRTMGVVRDRPLGPQVEERLRGANLKATLVARTTDHLVHLVVGACLRGPDLVRIQSEVVSGERVPEY